MFKFQLVFTLIFVIFEFLIFFLNKDKYYEQD